MRIDGMDASKVQNAGIQGSSVQTLESRLATKDEHKNNINISQMTEFDKMELPVSEKAVINAIEKANKAISGANRKFEFSIHEGTKEIMIKVLNADTNEVVREIPPEKILDMIAKMWEMAGIIVDERR